MSGSKAGIDNKAFDKDHEVGISDKQPPNEVRTVKKQSGREKCLLFLLAVFFLAVIGLIIAVVILAKDDSDSKPPVHIFPEVCLSTDCTFAAARVAEAMDPTYDPCEDFHKFSCAGWKRQNVIPEDMSVVNTMTVIEEEIVVVSKYLLEDKEKFTDIEGVQKARDMYTSCMDIEKIENKNSTPAVTLLEELGGWPVLGSNPGGNWDESDFSLIRLLVDLRKYGSASLIGMYVDVDFRNSEIYIIFIDQPVMGLPGRPYYVEPKLEVMREAYVKLATSTAVLFGADPTTAEQEMREVLQLEIEIANISMPMEDRRDYNALYNKMTIEHLKQNFTQPLVSDPIQFDWLDFLNGIMSLDDVNIPIDESEPVVVLAVPYFDKLFSVLQKYEKRVITNYLLWRAMMDTISNLDSRFSVILAEYKKVVLGVQAAQSRWKYCVSLIQTNFGMALGHMFVKETFDESAKAVVLEMIDHLRVSFAELLDDVDWMDGETKEAAQEKMEVIKPFIGYPDEIMDVDWVNEYYENITVHEEEYFMNKLNFTLQSSAYYLKKLRSKVDKNEWPTSPSAVNAFYSYLQNSIIFPAGILQPPFYSENQPQSLNYGGIGAVIGHEITHGFDDQGRQFDKYGNLQQWWKPEIIMKFAQQAQCMVEQYSNFVVPEVNLAVNGKNTIGENIADNGGIKQSYRAYRRWVEKRGGEEPTLPGLNYTNNQLFFIGFAQLWCNNERDASLIDRIKTDNHSPGQFRINGVLQNFPEFSEAFGCKRTGYMNPEKKCHVW